MSSDENTSDLIEQIATHLTEAQGGVHAVIRGTNSHMDGQYVDYDMLTEYSGRDGAIGLRPTGEVERRVDGTFALVVRPERTELFQITDNALGTGKYHVSRVRDDDWLPICASKAPQRRNGHTREPVSLQAALNQLQTINRHLWCRRCWVEGLSLEAPDGEDEAADRENSGENGPFLQRRRSRSAAEHQDNDRSAR